MIASRHPRPWIKQLNLLAAYAYFFNPLRLLVALVLSKSRIPLADAETWPPPGQADNRSRRRRFTRRLSRKLRAHLGDAAVQLFGIWGVLHLLPRMLGWTFHLMRGRIQRHTAPPTSRIPMRGPHGGPASHALPGTPLRIAPAAPVSEISRKCAQRRTVLGSFQALISLSTKTPFRFLEPEVDADQPVNLRPVPLWP